MKQSLVALDPSQPMAKIVEKIASLIIEIAQPQKIYLFGSGARGKMDHDSDLDFLIIVRGPIHRRHLEQQIYRNLHGVEVPVDVVVATEEDIRKYGDSIGTIYRPALREGLIIYES